MSGTGDTTQPMGAEPVDGDTTVPLDRTVIIPAAPPVEPAAAPRADPAGAPFESFTAEPVEPSAAAPVETTDPTVRLAGPAAVPSDLRPETAATGGDTATRQASQRHPAGVKPVMVAPLKRRRRALKPAPVPPGYGGRAVLGQGAGTVSTYRARAIPRPPAAPQELGGRGPVRATTGLVSVGRRSRRLSRAALVGFAVSLVIAVVGLVLIVRAVLAG